MLQTRPLLSARKSVACTVRVPGSRARRYPIGLVALTYGSPHLPVIALRVVPLTGQGFPVAAEDEGGGLAIRGALPPGTVGWAKTVVLPDLAGTSGSGHGLSAQRRVPVQAAQQSRPGETTAGICQVGLRNHGRGPMAAPALTETLWGRPFQIFGFGSTRT